MARTYDYDDENLFAHTRMTFGEHLEELRRHLLNALKGILFFVCIGFVLDTVGYLVEAPWLGIGRPMMRVITAPVKQELQAFHDRRLRRLETEKDEGQVDAVKATARTPMTLLLPPSAVKTIRGNQDEPAEPLEITVEMEPLQMYKSTHGVQRQVRPEELTTLSVAESMVVYIKVSLICSLVLASPWVFWQIWSFIGAGMYPHEKHYVHKYLPISLLLFIIGVLMCQFAVIPKSIEALLWFNDWLGFTPDLRLNEWLSFAILLPLVFGVSFQTPLVMLFLERIGIMSVEKYWAGWRIAVFGLAVFAAFITPTPDALTMVLMWVPLCGLYFFGIYLCKVSGVRRRPMEESDDADEHGAELMVEG